MAIQTIGGPRHAGHEVVAKDDSSIDMRVIWKSGIMGRFVRCRFTKLLVVDSRQPAVGVLMARES